MELERNIWAEPPEEVKQYLNMKPHELWRVAKAVYGLCHAPRKWFEKLQSVLWSHWQSHQDRLPAPIRLLRFVDT